MAREKQRDSERAYRSETLLFAILVDLELILLDKLMLKLIHTRLKAPSLNSHMLVRKNGIKNGPSNVLITLTNGHFLV